MGVGRYSKSKSEGSPPTGMFGQLMGREDLAAHSKFKGKGKKGKSQRGRGGAGRRGRAGGTKKPGY